MYKREGAKPQKRLKKKDIGSPVPAEVTENSVATQALLRGDKSAVENYQALLSWKKLPSDLSLVHALRLGLHADSELLSENAEKCFSGWDAISATLISRRDQTSTRYFDSARRLFSVAHPTAIGEIAFVLELSPSNIIGTFPYDVWFDNHAGMRRGGGEASQSIESKGALSNAILKGIPRNNAPVNLPKGTYLDVRPYQAILRDQRANPNSQYSEIIIAGREGVHIHAGMAKTKAVTVKEILVMPHDEVEWRDGNPLIREDLKLALERLKILNPNIPINFIG